MTNRNNTAGAQRATANNPAALVECKDRNEQLASWAKRAAHALNKEKSFGLTLSPADLEGLQFHVGLNSKGAKGTFKPAPEAKDGEVLRSVGTISAPTRATDQVSAAGIDVRIIRRLMEGLAERANHGIEDQSTKRANKQAWGLQVNPKALAEAKASDKETAKATGKPCNIAEASLTHKLESNLEAIALKVLAKVKANPVGVIYTDLPDPASKTISCALACPNCGGNHEYAERRLPLSEEAIRQAATELPFCGECTTPEALHRLEYKGGTDALVAKALEKYAKVIAENEASEAFTSNSSDAIAETITPEHSGTELRQGISNLVNLQTSERLHALLTASA